MKKRICFIVSSPITISAFMSDHIRSLAEHYELHVVANFNNAALGGLDVLPIKKTHHFNISREISIGNDLSVLWKIFIFLKQEKFDAVHTITPKAGLIGGMAAFAARVKKRSHIFTGQVWANDTGLRRTFFKFLDKIIFRLATDVLVDGNSQKNYLLQEKIVNTEKAQVLGKGSISGVHLKRFARNESDRNRIRKELKINEDETVIIFLGRLNPDKGIFTLAKAFDILQERLGKIKLLYVGPDEGGYEEEIRELMNQDTNLIFYGKTSTPNVLLSAADIFCLPSFREGFGSSVIEASAAGLPVVCSDVYGLQDAFVPQVTGLRHEVKNENDLAACLEQLIVDTQQREKMGQAGIQYVRENFDHQLISSLFVKFFQQRLGSQS